MWFSHHLEILSSHISSHLDRNTSLRQSVSGWFRPLQAQPLELNSSNLPEVAHWTSSLLIQWKSFLNTKTKDYKKVGDIEFLSIWFWFLITLLGNICEVIGIHITQAPNKYWTLYECLGFFVLWDTRKFRNAFGNRSPLLRLHKKDM